MSKNPNKYYEDSSLFNAPFHGGYGNAQAFHSGNSNGGNNNGGNNNGGNNNAASNDQYGQDQAQQDQYGNNQQGIDDDDLTMVEPDPFLGNPLEDRAFINHVKMHGKIELPPLEALQAAESGDKMEVEERNEPQQPPAHIQANTHSSHQATTNAQQSNSAAHPNNNNNNNNDHHNQNFNYNNNNFNNNNNNNNAYNPPNTGHPVPSAPDQSQMQNLAPNAYSPQQVQSNLNTFNAQRINYQQYDINNNNNNNNYQVASGYQSLLNANQQYDNNNNNNNSQQEQFGYYGRYGSPGPYQHQAKASGNTNLSHQSTSNTHQSNVSGPSNKNSNNNDNNTNRSKPHWSTVLIQRQQLRNRSMFPNNNNPQNTGNSAYSAHHQSRMSSSQPVSINPAVQQQLQPNRPFPNMLPQSTSVPFDQMNMNDNNANINNNTNSSSNYFNPILPSNNQTTNTNYRSKMKKVIGFRNGNKGNGFIVWIARANNDEKHNDEDKVKDTIAWGESTDTGNYAKPHYPPKKERIDQKGYTIGYSNKPSDASKTKKSDYEEASDYTIKKLSDGSFIRLYKATSEIVTFNWDNAIEIHDF